MNRGEVADLILDLELRPQDKLVLHGYLKHLPNGPVEDGTAWPGLARLCVYAGTGETATRAARRRLFELGLLVQVGTSDRGDIIARIDTARLETLAAEGRAAAEARMLARLEEVDTVEEGPPHEANPLTRRTPSRGEPPHEARGTPSPDGGDPLTRRTQTLLKNPPQEPSSSLSSADADPAPVEPTPTAAAEPVQDITSPDDPALLLLGKGVKAHKLRPPELQVYRAWWRRQASPATCRLTASRLGLIRAALDDGYPPEDLERVVSFAYEARPGPGGIPETFHRAWRGEHGQGLPGLEMLFRRCHIARNVEMASAWDPETPPAATQLQALPGGRQSGRPNLAERLAAITAGWDDEDEEGGRASA